MALSNSQYDAIMREYGKQQMENQHSQEAQKKEIYQKVPAVKEIRGRESRSGPLPVPENF